MTATILDGKAISAQIRAQVAERVMALVDRGTQPGLAAVLVGDDEVLAVAEERGMAVVLTGRRHFRH